MARGTPRRRGPDPTVTSSCRRPNRPWAAGRARTASPASCRPPVAARGGLDDPPPPVRMNDAGRRGLAQTREWRDPRRVSAPRLTRVRSRGWGSSAESEARPEPEVAAREPAVAPATARRIVRCVNPDMVDCLVISGTADPVLQRFCMTWMRILKPLPGNCQPRRTGPHPPGSSSDSVRRCPPGEALRSRPAPWIRDHHAISTSCLRKRAGRGIPVHSSRCGRFTLEIRSQKARHSRRNREFSSLFQRVMVPVAADCR